MVCLMMSHTFAQSVEVTVCRFHNDKPAAVSLTFDDGLLDHDTVVRPLLAKYGYKGTFYVVEKYADTAMANRTDPSKRQCMSWEQVKALADDGHEIGNHSYSHYQLTKAKSEADVDKEINGPIPTFEKKLGFKPLTFCFPGNARNDQIVAMAMVNHINTTAMPRQMFGGDKYTHQQTVDWIDRTITHKQWGMAMIHAIIHEGHGWAPFPNDEKDFIAVLDLLKANDDKLWIDTFANVSKYVKLRDSVTVVMDETREHFTLKTDLDTKLYDMPLTVKVSHGDNERLINVMPNTATMIR
jgi:peptidoglycan/xylan/chitin deacetylase (PgdA/CDA1 family)